jgi:hypothetical protein
LAATTGQAWLAERTNAVDWQIDSKPNFADAKTFCVRGMQVSGAESSIARARRGDVSSVTRPSERSRQKRHRYAAAAILDTPAFQDKCVIWRLAMKTAFLSGNRCDGLC